MTTPTRVTLASTVRMYIDEKDADNSHFTDEEIYGFLNQSIRFMGTDLEWPLQTAEATSVTDEAVYTLPTNFVSLLDVYLDGRRLTICERSDLAGFNDQWQNQDSGEPLYAYKSDNAKFGLWPFPSSDFNAKTIQIQYIKVPDDIDDDSSTPDLHLALVDCLPFYASFLCHHSLGNKNSAQANLDLYEYHKKKLMTKVQRFSDDNMRFRWSEVKYYV